MNREEKLRLAIDDRTAPETLSDLAQDEDEEIRLLVSINQSTPRNSLYYGLDFDEIRSNLASLKEWREKYGDMTEITESELTKYSKSQVWSEMNNDYEVTLESGIIEDANRFFVTENSRTEDDDAPHLVSVVTALYLSCPLEIDFYGLEYEGTPKCCGGSGRIFINLENLINDESEESIVDYVEWYESN